MRPLGNVLGGGVLGLIVIGVFIFAMRAIGTFVQFMPTLPWSIGVALLAVTLVIGPARDRVGGFVVVVLWVLGIGVALVIGQGNDGVSPMWAALFHVIPWAFVVCCLFACALNEIEYHVRFAGWFGAFLVASLFVGLLIAGARFSSAILLTTIGVPAVHVIVRWLVGVDLFRAVLRRCGGMNCDAYET